MLFMITIAYRIEYLQLKLPLIQILLPTSICRVKRYSTNRLNAFKSRMNLVCSPGCVWSINTLKFTYSYTSLFDSTLRNEYIHNVLSPTFNTLISLSLRLIINLTFGLVKALIFEYVSCCTYVHQSQILDCLRHWYFQMLEQ